LAGAGLQLTDGIVTFARLSTLGVACALRRAAEKYGFCFSRLKSRRRIKCCAHDWQHGPLSDFFWSPQRWQIFI
jgi:hypothetical protein